MGVPCPRCGREYDATLFAFGRTLWCACGSRVGVAPRVRRLAAGAPAPFFADAMLGRLARWLRLLGVDCAYEREIGDEELVRRASAEGRVILSRDRSLPEDWWVSDIYLVGAEDFREQLREVVRAFGLARSLRPFSRCSECNEPLRATSPADVAARVPARVLASQDAFRVCPSCGRVYWEGSHSERIRRVAEDVLQRG